ncbi:MAG: 3-methyl-2-oxobutanoate hydroxymethyltransferase [bacterium]
MAKVTPREIQTSKSQHRKLSMLTAYDYSFAKILDEAGLDMILVGDSLGNVVMGDDNTHGVTMADMVHHTKAVCRGVERALVVADMPFGAMKNPVENAQALISAGAEAVKVEGMVIVGIKEIVALGIPVMGHLGLLPQTAIEYKKQKSPEIVEQAKALEQAGVFAIVLEMVPDDLAAEVTKSVKVPTIGCGAGDKCDGKVVVLYDLLGLYPKAPSFVKKQADLQSIITQAVKKFMLE